MQRSFLIPVSILSATLLYGCGQRKATPQTQLPTAPKATVDKNSGNNSDGLGARAPRGNGVKDARGAYVDVACTETTCNPVNVKLELFGKTDPVHNQGFMWQSGSAVDWRVKIVAEKAQRKMGIRLAKELMMDKTMDSARVGQGQDSIKINWTPRLKKLEGMIEFVVRDIDRCAALSPDHLKADCHEMGVKSMFDFPIKVPFFIGDVFSAEKEQNNLSPWSGLATCLASGILQQLGVGDLTNDLVTGVVGGMMGGKVKDCRDKDYKGDDQESDSTTVTTSTSTSKPGGGGTFDSQGGNTFNDEEPR